METPPLTKVALVDDHALFRGGLRGLLQASGRCQVVLEAGNGSELMEQLAAGEGIDVVLLDIDMPVMGGFEVARRLGAEYPAIRMITLSMHSQEEYYFRMVSLGAKGFLLKNSQIGEVLAAIETVAAGGTYFSQELLTMLVRSLHAPAAEGAATLSERETEILQLICRGLSNHEIAEKLFISKRTVDKHRANILEKTGTNNTANLVVFAIKNSLITL